MKSRAIPFSSSAARDRASARRSFLRGGFVVDGGHGHAKSLPPVVASLPFPEDWRIILVMDGETKGVHGDAEREAFAKLPLFPESEAAKICHAVLMGALPALVERDLATFGDAISDIQKRLGDYFAPAQGGARYTSAKVAAVMDRLERLARKGLDRVPGGRQASPSSKTRQRRTASLALSRKTAHKQIRPC